MAVRTMSRWQLRRTTFAGARLLLGTAIALAGCVTNEADTEIAPGAGRLQGDGRLLHGFDRGFYRAPRINAATLDDYVRGVDLIARARLVDAEFSWVEIIDHGNHTDVLQWWYLVFEVDAILAGAVDEESH